MAQRILVIETGGTICMRQGPEGLVPEEGVLADALARMSTGLDITTRRIGPLRDSAEMGPAEWNAILDLIDGWEGDGVLVTHGTDTMAFTGAALAAALPTPRVPVILCGSMQPLGATDGDAEGNLMLALDAVRSGAPGHYLCFAGKRMEAGSLVKHHSHQADAFRATGGGTTPLPAASRYGACRLAILTVAPGMPLAAEALAAILAGLDGAVLRVFGAGTIMQDKGLLSVLRDAVARGCRIVAVSQCEQGGLEAGAYAAGAAIWAAGVVNGGDMTAERAYCTLWLDLSVGKAALT
jgi:L-asparaginase